LRRVLAGTDLLNLPIESGFLVILAWQEVQPCLSETKPRGAVPLGTGILSQPKRIGREPAVRRSDS
jgi:hypothetical protein